MKENNYLNNAVIVTDIIDDELILADWTIDISTPIRNRINYLVSRLIDRKGLKVSFDKHLNMVVMFIDNDHYSEADFAEDVGQIVLSTKQDFMFKWAKCLTFPMIVDKQGITSVW